MHRTAVGNFHHPRPLVNIERAVEMNLAIDHIAAIDVLSGKTNRRVGEGPSFALRVETKRQRRAGRERGKQNLVWARSGVAAALFFGLVGPQVMRSDLDVRRQHGAFDPASLDLSHPLIRTLMPRFRIEPSQCPFVYKGTDLSRLRGDRPKVCPLENCDARSS